MRCTSHRLVGCCGIYICIYSKLKPARHHHSQLAAGDPPAAGSGAVQKRPASSSVLGSSLLPADYSNCTSPLLHRELACRWLANGQWDLKNPIPATGESLSPPTSFSGYSTRRRRRRRRRRRHCRPGRQTARNCTPDRIQCTSRT